MKLTIIISLLFLMLTPSITVSAQEINQDVNINRESKLLKILEKKRLELESKERFLAEQAKRLNAIKEDILKRLKKLQSLKKELDTYFQKLKEMQNERYDKLAQIYASTPPQEAGKQLEKLDPKVAAQVMLRLDGKKAGKIWGYLPPQTASRIAQEMLKLR